MRGNATGRSAVSDGTVEVTDILKALPGDGGEAWTQASKQRLRKAFSTFGVVADVRIPTSVAIVKFSSSSATEAVMRAAPRGFMRCGDGEVRVRIPSAPDTVWRKFPPPKSEDKKSISKAASHVEDASGSIPTKKLRPNERFATKSPKSMSEPLDESEMFWEAQKELQGKPAEPPAVEADPPPSEPAKPPEKPEPSVANPDASAEEVEACKGEQEVSKEMEQLLELPFSKQRKALKALRLKWHPDKRLECRDVATRVFQYIQAHDDWLAHHGLS